MSEEQGTTQPIRQLETLLGFPALFAVVSTTIGLSGGFLTGGVTAVMYNLIETPLAVPHILRLTRLFGLAGVVHGIVGAGLISIKGRDDFRNRMLSGCAAGLSMGISQGKPAVGCGLCALLAALSSLEKASQTIFVKEQARAISTKPNQLAPLYKKDELWFEQIRESIKAQGKGE